MKILMVCLGNICRSPMADGMMRQIVKERNMDVEVDGAGTASYHVGDPPDRRMQATALEHGVDISYLRARQFVAEDFDRFDIIYAMDRSNYNNITALGTPDQIGKVKMLLDEIHPGKRLEVPDPYYGGDEGFEAVFQMVKSACETIADKIESGEYS